MVETIKNGQQQKQLGWLKWTLQLQNVRHWFSCFWSTKSLARMEAFKLLQCIIDHRDTNYLITRIVFLRKIRCLPPFDVKSMRHWLQFQTETLNTISYKNSSHFMQTISSYLVKISVNVVYYGTIMTWHKIVIDNCFCDGQSSKGNNSKSIKKYRVTILALCTSTHVGWYLYKVSWI